MSLDEHAPPHQSPPPQPGTSGLAVAGLILAFLLAPIGFILSLIAIFKTGPGRRKGRGLAVAGLVISLLAIGGAVTAGLVIANSTVADPGCTEAKAAILDSPSAADPASLQATVDKLNAAAGKAKHDDVKVATKAVADDYAKMVEGVKAGKLPDGINEKLQADAEAFDKLCTVGS
ncbi:DUF4190 domain-containing protein [Actinoplanes sp. NPDC049265]|uniref:DUF4190 domain-containing protein n=1 Tax=Actinoplanes sp. NPDC049265 TaxID=3363902 RepID=UPI003713B402